MKAQLEKKLMDKRLKDALTVGVVDMRDGNTLYKFLYQIDNQPKGVVSKPHYIKTMYKITKGTFFKTI